MYLGGFALVLISVSMVVFLDHPAVLHGFPLSLHRSEGEAERDIGSLCMIGLGLMVVEKFFRRRRRRRRRRPQVLVHQWLVHQWLVHQWLF